MRVKIIQDLDADVSPRDAYNLGVMACWHKRYSLGDEQPAEDPEEWRKSMEDGTIFRPLFLMDHSGITMSTSPFNCMWDSGQVGWIYVTPSRWKKEYPDLEEEAVIAAVTKALDAEVALYDQYLRGQIWGYEVRDTCDKCAHELDTVVDSCWGFYGDTLEETGIKDHVEEKLWPQLEAAWEARA